VGTVRHDIEQAALRIPSEPYPELPQVLETFVAGIHQSLEENLIGAYLVGSLATGDFDLDSDIDFLIVVGDELTDAEVSRLQAWHVRIHDLPYYAARHLEGSYISKQVLTRADLVGVQSLWYVDNGSTVLERSPHDNQWHVRWILRERAITLTGPDPKSLLPPISTGALRSEMRTTIKTLQANCIAEMGKPMQWFNTRFGQSFTVLTCCRMLHSLHTGTVESKRAAVKWAEQSLDANWRELIRQAWAERNGVRFGLKVRQPADAGLLHKTAQFIVYTLNELDSRVA
jgi:predicted nucleotidyltransferase